MLEELKFLVKLYCAGQGPCHSYVQQRGRTGGWTDMWCQHDMKVASKMETMQVWLNTSVFIAFFLGSKIHNFALIVLKAVLIINIVQLGPSPNPKPKR